MTALVCNATFVTRKWHQDSYNVQYLHCSARLKTSTTFWNTVQL